MTLIAVGFGTEQGSTIPVHTAQGISAKRDEDGHIVTTRYTPEMLQAAATAAHGVFIDARATDKAVRIRAALASLRRQARSTESESMHRARFQLFLIPALLLVLLDSMLASRRGRRRASAAASATALACCLLFVPSALRAETGDTADQLFKSGHFPEAAAAYQREIQEHADSPRLEYNLGTALLQAGQLDDAVAALERAATTAATPDLRYSALYNLGLAYLQLRPQEVAAKWNYELATTQKSHSSGGGGQSQPPQQSQQQQQPRPSNGLDKRQAEQLLSSAQREERDVQARKQRENQPERPPAGKDW